MLLEHLPADFDVTVMGSSRSTVQRVAAWRPSSRTVVVPAVSSKRDARAIVTQVRAMRMLAPDICFVNLQTPYAGQYGQLAGLLAGAEVVVTEHLPLATTSSFRRWLKRHLSARLAAHVGVGESAARMIERDAGLPSGSIAVIHNGVPRPKAGEHPRRLLPGIVVGSIGRLDGQKGYDVAIEAMATVVGASLVLVGEGKEKPVLAELVGSSGVEGRVVFTTGWGDDGMKLVAGFDVFVLPSRFEGFPLSILEAMHRGKPVVATTVGSVPEMVIEGETGLLVPAGDVVALADALNRLVADDELRQRLGKNGQARAAALFDQQQMTAAYESLFRKLCDAEGTRERQADEQAVEPTAATRTD